MTRVVGHGTAAVTRARARVKAISAACPDGVMLPLEVSLDDRDDAVATYAVAPEPALAEIASGAGLTLGECLTVGVTAARTLAAMHAAGICHGDVSPSNVLARAHHVILIDAVASADAGERGTPGCAAPERARGASPPADVYALGATLRAIADDDARDVVWAWTEPLLRDDPGARPSAAHAARALERCAPLTPVRTDEPTVAQAVRASATAATVRRPDARWWRVERLARRVVPMACLAGLAVAVGAAVVPDAKANSERPAASAAMPVPALATMAPDAAAVELTRRRIGAIEASDTAALGALVTPGGPAAAAAAHTMRELDAGAIDFAGLSIEAITATTLARAGIEATVRVGYDLGAYSVTRGGVTQRVAASTDAAVLVMRLTLQGWTVQRILPAP